MIKAPRGTHDILPSESYRWHAVEDQIKKICLEFGYKEIRTPMFESTELFERGVKKSQLQKTFMRSRASIEARLVKLGLIEERFRFWRR